MFKTFQQKYPIFCVITTIIESIYHIKRSKPVRYAKATLTRFGSVLRGTSAPLRTPIMPAPLRDCSFRAKALQSQTRVRSAATLRVYIGNKVKRL